LQVLFTQKLLVGAGLSVVAFASWLTSILSAGGSMMMGFSLDMASLLLFAYSWTVGMMAMMFPTAVPMMMTFFSAGMRSRPEIRAGGGPTPGKASLFVASYLGIWVGAGVLIYSGIGAATAFIGASWLMINATQTGAGIALLITGLYQLSPIKGECLDKCHPTHFLYRFYRGGRLGAAKMGALYAKYCVGCCWVMMVFLLLVGSMGILWMALFTALIFLERSLIRSPWPSRAIGAAFLVVGLALLLVAPPTSSA